MGFVIVLSTYRFRPFSINLLHTISFHGLASFYRKFIRGFNSICGLLTETMRGDRKKYKWTIGADNIFALYMV